MCLGLHIRTRTWPFDKTDINRMFPGHSGGETTQRIAAALFELTKTAEVRVDIHSSNAEFEELPQVRLYGSSEEERRIGNLLGLPAMVECPMNTISTSTLLHAWKESGGQNLVIQAGAAGNLQMAHCDRLFNGIVAVAVAFGYHVAGGSLPVDEGDTEENDDRVFSVEANRFADFRKGGLVRSENRRRDSWIEKGSLARTCLRRVQRPRSRAHQSARAGFLTGLRYQALIYQGDLLARIQSPVDVTEGADTYLIGHGQ